jgi:integrase
MTAIEWVARANSRLSGTGLKLELSGKSDNLSVRGVFPRKPWEENKPDRVQVRLSLEAKALSESVVKKAELTVRQLAIDIAKGEFDWCEFLGIEDPRIVASRTQSLIGAFADRLVEEKKHTVGDYTWRHSYQALLDKLPRSIAISEDALIAWILDCDPHCSTSRRYYVSIATSLAEMADIKTARIKRLHRPNSSKVLNPRDLPEDEMIESFGLAIAHPEWRQVYGMLAVYGLRPHELFRLDLSRFPDVRTLPNTKTGERVVPPIYPKWVDRFELSPDFKPPLSLQWKEEDENWRLGRKIGSAFTKRKYGDPYDLRHCYARRCLELGLTSDVSAALMGHSRGVHESVYRRFIKSSTYLDAAKNTIYRFDQ